VRAGTRTATALRDAALDAAEERSRSHLCIIARADRSGARFWFPDLADRARRRGLPPRLFVCATLDDEKSDEAKLVLREGIALRIDDVIAPAAAVVVPAVIAGPGAAVRELRPPERVVDLTPAVPTLAAVGGSLGITGAARLARIYIAASLLMESGTAEAFMRETSSQFSGADTPPTDTSAPNLKMIAAGGTHA
jgi:hypothetical protein